ncbi:MAG: hypothetical protein ACYSUS_06025 [Planctomycetota bacterium]|jgi:hypothetical protein
MKKPKGKIQSGLLTGLVLAVAISAGVVAFILSDASGTKSTLGPEYSYDIEQYAKIDPSLIVYQQTGEPIKTDFEKTSAVAVGADGRIYIAGDEKITIYTSGFSVQTEVELKGEPTCVEVETDGTMVVCVKSDVIFINPTGVEIDGWTIPADNAILSAKRTPTGISPAS